MDRAQYRGKWKKKCCFTLFFLICLDVCAAAAVPAICKGDEFRSEKGHCCNKCPPGFRLVEQCKGPGLRSNCSACPDGQYLDVTNYREKCLRCGTCNNENHKEESSKCKNTKDTVCKCQDGYAQKFIDDKTWDCIKQPEVTTVLPKTCEEPGYHWSFFVGVPLAAVTAVVLVAFVIYKFRKRIQFGVGRSPCPLDPAPAESLTEKFLFSSTFEKNSSIQESTPGSCVFSGGQPPNLTPEMPDCIPKESVKFSQFVYFVLDAIPVARFKELMRHLDVNEPDIERAERDNHNFKEAQHQMLRVWGEREGGVVRGTLPLPLVQELLNKLRTMGLGGCADAIEDKYSIQ